MTTHCILCHTPVRPRTAAGKHGEFCCTGCEKVYDVLTRLDDDAKAAYVETARKLGLIPSGPEEIPSNPPSSSPPVPIAERTDRLAVEGLVCPSCSWVAGEVLGAEEGVVRAEINYFTGTAEITYDMAKTSTDDLDELLKPLGYRLRALDREAGIQASRKNTFDFLLVAILTMNVMSLSVLRYFHTLGYLSDLPGYLAYLEGALVLPVLAIGWVPTVRRAVAALFRRRLTMDMLIAIGVAAAALLSYLSLLTGHQDIYFETCAGLVTISLLSRMIEARLRNRAFEALRTLMKMPVIRVRRVCEDAEDFVDTREIAAKDRVRFLPTELVPFDGEVIGETVVVSEAVLTGEPTPKTKHAGDLITAGSAVTEGVLEMAVTRTFDDTLLSRITRSIGETLSKQEGHLRQADRIAAWFIPLVVLVALSAFVVRAVMFGMDVALSAEGWFPSVAVLAVACPCAFSLAGISAVTAATGVLLRLGFLVKELDGLEMLSKIDHAVFDKTGTLTKGEMSVTGLFWQDAPDTDILSRVLAAEHRSGHPVAAAIRAHCAAEGILPAVEPDAIEEIPGQGRAAIFGDARLTIGAAPLFDDPFLPEAMTPAHSAVWFGRGRQAVGAFLLTDDIREEAKDAVAALKEMGIAVELLSGDRQAVTVAVGDAVGITACRGDASIDDKIARVASLKDSGKTVVFIGDGTNDALAMNAAHLSVALSKSTDEALAASDFVALKGNLGHLKWLFTLGRALSRIVTENYVWAFAFNTLFIPVAAAGKLLPLVAMLLMLLSSAAVLLNAARLGRRFGPFRKAQ